MELVPPRDVADTGPAVEFPFPRSAPPASRVAAIPFPDAAELESGRARRRRQDEVLAERQAATRFDAKLRNQQSLATAYANGKSEGDHSGYVRGVQWGMVCGAVACAVVLAALALLRDWALTL